MVTLTDSSLQLFALRHTVIHVYRLSTTPEMPSFTVRHFWTVESDLIYFLILATVQLDWTAVALEVERDIYIFDGWLFDLQFH